ncbi:hypothetical protein QNI19_19595 [Cytophagaceae bacterium DM2B3-1]|uniref:Uncharacterized protein n=1 Tax=Xanthocytophaga flava TaxID=3048013 RepID=A0ABT7CN29_9BACT|nr:hypothetical protein [Xanthocytophaga flavus]MDJ1495153.1 hypothetical protein [Xanthocytophaga flavus]
METREFKNQLEKVFDAFYEKPRTMKEVDFACGVMRENICRYVSKLRKQGRIILAGKRYCKITKHQANVYTTNPSLIPKVIQLNILGDH